ncbi:hypothetical protein Fmac_023253 [Flemingia macrophylla]|uniref:Mediator of RNA polymerase II transcription subunit n=1 Tax=Flemingia macrophylla TaxID=520843 RepID=A0ABD1LL11_9FABA
MQSTWLFHSSQSQSLFHGFSAPSKPFWYSKGRKRSVASMGDHELGGRLVDESMIILRKRIHEMNMIERNYEPPSDWMDWEKRYYTSYDSFICQVVGVLQTQLMNTRPSFALGAMALVAITVPASTAVLFFHLLHFAQALSSFN